MVDIDSLPRFEIEYPSLRTTFHMEESPTRDTVIDTAALGLEAGRPFLATAREMLTPEVYDINIEATAHDSHTRQPVGLLEPIEISLFPIKKDPPRAFGAAETFEGDGFLAAAAIAGAIGILALVGGGIYLTYQLQKAAEFGAELLRPGMELGKAAVEAIIPDSVE